MIGKTSSDAQDSEITQFSAVRVTAETARRGFVAGRVRAYVLTYGVAAVAVALTIPLTELILTTTGHTIFAMFYAAVAISAWYGGLGPGLLAVGLSALASGYFFLPPRYDLGLNLAGLVQFGIFLLVALLIGSLTGARQRAETFAWRQYEQLQVTLKSIGDAVITTDSDGRVLFMNPVAEALTGWNRGEAAGRPLEEVFRIVMEGTGTPAENPVRRVIREGKIVGLANHTLLLARDGREMSIDDSAAPIRDEKGWITGVVLIFRDITDRRQIEKALQQHTRILAEQAQLLGLAQDGIITWDMNGRITFWNRGAEALYGWSKIEALGQNIQALLQTRFPQPLEEILAQLMETGHWEGELVHTHRNGMQLVVASRWAVGRNAQDQPVKILEITTNISELRRTEQAQRRLAEAGVLLATSLDYETTLNTLANLVVPNLADWCSIYTLEEDGSVRRLVVTHHDPARLKLGQEFQQRYPIDWNEPHGLPQVLRTGQPELVPEVTDALLASRISDEEQLQKARELGVTSTMIVPMIARGQTLGAITFVWADSGHHYDQDDLILAEELARRAALAVANVRLYQAEQQARQTSEHTAHRIARLQTATAALSAALTETQVTEVIVQQGMAAVGAQTGFVVMLVEDGQSLELVYGAGYPEGYLEKFGGRFPLTGPDIAAEAIRQGEPVWIKSNQEFQARYPHLAGARNTLGNQAIAVIPLQVQGRPLGAVGWGFPEAREFRIAEQEFLLTLAHQCTQALERARLYEAAQQARVEAQREVEAHRLTEQKLKVSLEEKEVLLREIHHRVKNNLQAVSNLLYLQAHYLPDPLARQKFEETQGRVRSIALIHEKLYQTQDFTRVNFAEYVEELVRHLIQSHKANPDLIRLAIEDDGTVVEVDTAVPLGIIINELVSNALKYAFAEDQAGEIRVAVRAEAPGQLVLTVSDNGVGFPEDKDLANSSSMGLQLVQMLAGHMQGQVELVREANGTCFKVSFTPIPRE